MIEVHINPTLASLGPLEISWHGILIGSGVALILALLWRAAAREALPPDKISWFVIFALLGGIAGARLLHVIDLWEDYARDPWAIPRVWEGGLAIYGGILGALGGGALYARRAGLPLRKILDLATPGAILGHMIGRMGCFINGDAYGTPTSLPWGVIYTHPDSVPARLGITWPTHPAPLYEIALCAAIFFLIPKLRFKFPEEGSSFLLYLLLYSIGRFFISFVRVNEPFVSNLNEAQFFALLTAGFSLYFLLRAKLKQI